MSEHWLYIAIGAVLFAAVVGVYIYQQGMLGTASVARIRKKLASLANEMGRWEQELTDALAAEKTKAAATKAKADKGIPTLNDAVDKLDKLHSLEGLLSRKSITQQQFERQRDAIMGPPA